MMGKLLEFPKTTTDAEIETPFDVAEEMEAAVLRKIGSLSVDDAILYLQNELAMAEFNQEVQAIHAETVAELLEGMVAA